MWNKHEIQVDISLRNHLKPLLLYLSDKDITEVCVNRAGEVWCEKRSSWKRHDTPDITLRLLEKIAKAAAAYTDQKDFGKKKPILSATLPDGERLQVVIPPACEQGTISLTIRKPSFVAPSLGVYRDSGFFKEIQEAEKQKEGLLDVYRQEGDYFRFFQEAVRAQKVIVVCGETGSGKTTFMKALIDEIPEGERLITIEDVPELSLPKHPNHVHLYYPSEAKEEENASVTAASLLKSCLRMKPTRILLGELRGAEAFDFLNVASSGHGGTITSCHAGSPSLAFERLALMVLQNRQGRTLPHTIIHSLLRQVIDIIVHIHNDVGGKGRHITEIYLKEPQLVSKKPLHGDARFATAKEIASAGLLEEEGILVGKYKGKDLAFGGQQSPLLSVPPRSGMGVGLHIPDLRNGEGHD